MATDSKRIPNFDDIVFEIRNKQYGAYILRKKYSRNVIISLLIGITIICASVITPYLNAKATGDSHKMQETQIVVKLGPIDQHTETVVPPPPPPPSEDIIKEARYLPPDIVDALKPGEASQLMTAEQAQTDVRDKGVIEIQPISQEIQDEVAVVEPFYKVEEMPLFPGGPDELLKYLAEHTQYPEVPKENNIQGKVIVKFCVTPTGGVDKVSIIKSIDPELDKEAIRVVYSLPEFKPGKQGGKAVPVWFVVPISFKLR
jgi:periplasmic protein TonB